MTDLIIKLIDIAANVVPIRIVHTWEQGLYFVGGKYRGTVGPGIKFVVPGICDVKCVSMVPDIATTPMQTVTLRDNRTLTYSASFTFHVFDANLAFNTVGRYQETIVELASRIISDNLTSADPDRFESQKGIRDRLMAEIRVEVDRACRKYGVTITQLGFNNFALGVRTLRLLMDPAVLLAGNHFGGV